MSATKLWHTLTDAQAEDVKSGRIRISVNAEGKVVALDVDRKISAVDRTVKLAVERLAAKV